MKTFRNNKAGRHGNGRHGNDCYRYWSWQVLSIGWTGGKRPCKQHPGGSTGRNWWATTTDCDWSGLRCCASHTGKDSPIRRSQEASSQVPHCGRWSSASAVGSRQSAASRLTIQSGRHFQYNIFCWYRTSYFDFHANFVLCWIHWIQWMLRHSKLDSKARPLAPVPRCFSFIGHPHLAHFSFLLWHAY